MKEKEITEKILMKSKTSNIYRYIQLVFSLFILALLYNFFIQPAYLTTGGVNGIAILLKYLFRIKPVITISIISFFLLILNYLFLGKERTKGTLLATILYPLFIHLTSYLKPLIDINMNDMLIISIFIGVIGGICNGLIYKTGFNNGGLPVISQILFHKFKIPMGKTNLAINSIIVLIGGYYFGFTMIMYAIIINYINSVVVDKILLGISRNKSIYIVTEKTQEIKDFITNEMKHTVTVFKAEGAYSGKKKDIILSIIPTREYFQITESIKLLDPEIFYVVSDAYEVKGAK
ncbi:MAG: YitT family protein [Bacilli bacterium]|nr:YitT family protein [Bacilli bacterium]